MGQVTAGLLASGHFTYEDAEDGPKACRGSYNMSDPDEPPKIVWYFHAVDQSEVIVDSILRTEQRRLSNL